MANPNDKCCNVDLPVDATVQQPAATSLKDLARQALRESSPPKDVASVASVAGVAHVAPFGIRAQLKSLAKHIGVPPSVVESLSDEDLLAAEEQVAHCNGHLDSDGNPLARHLLTFYLQTLASINPSERSKS